MGLPEENEMGWMVGWKSKDEVIKHVLDQCNTGGMKLLDKSVVGGAVYALIGKGEEKFIAIFLIKGYRDDAFGPAQWGYKDMDETCGPNEDNCPERLLAQSTVMDGYAPEWRARCRAKRAAKNGGRKFAAGLKPGDSFQWNEHVVKFAGWVTQRGKQILTGYSPRDGKLYCYPAGRIGPVVAP